MTTDLRPGADDRHDVYVDTVEVNTAEAREAVIQYFTISGAPVKTESARNIVENLIPEFLEHFLPKNADYGDQHRSGLGPRGEFVGLHRKMAKLEKAVWEGKQMNHEGPQEMLRDLIGTALLMLDLYSLEPPA